MMSYTIDVESMILRILKHTVEDIETTLIEKQCTLTEAIDIILKQREADDEHSND